MSLVFRNRKCKEEYKRYKNEHHRDDKGHFSDWQTRLVREYKYWAIIENNFPYNRVAKISHILITKRVTPFEWELLNKNEEQEFKNIKKELGKEYDVLLENLFHQKSVTAHFHLHLLKLK